MRVAIHSIALLAVVALAACGGAEPVATTPPVTSTAAAAQTPAPPATAVPAAAAGTRFKEMSNDQKLQHMKTVIAPTMGPLFTAFDAKRYGSFGCATCHGEKKEDPHKALPRLTLSGDGFKKLFAEKPAVMKFMTEQVAPTMAKAMNEKPFDPATNQGFGCGGCHAVQ